MSISATKNETLAAKGQQARQPDWQTLLFWAAVVALFALAIPMRLYHLGLPFDRDSYDEGVYWQSLRAMGAGHALYSDIFYSQPPFFLLSTYPLYALFGASLWSARLGIAVVSLFGLAGALLLGKALSGRLGALAALLLAVVDPLFLAQSQTIQAEASSVAFSLLAIGLAFYWWKYPLGRRGLLLAILTGVTVALSIMCKLLGVALLVPIALMMAVRLWKGVENEHDVNMESVAGQGDREGRPY
ncbi:MAG TPA: phospholipid carrier-dependent glycosyltransferase, partial [Ktedonobacteraceae bacterium]|nr:phospholipid carrier-dependent glycosyltransferase [Ktedonobacteraceae bacterium]